MTRINSAINVRSLTDEHLLAEHREIKRLPKYTLKSIHSKDNFLNIPKEFCLGSGHISFFLNKHSFIFDRYKQIKDECIKRGFEITNYEENWNELNSLRCWDTYTPTLEEKALLINRIKERINNSSKNEFHYFRIKITKQEAIKLLQKT